MPYSAASRASSSSSERLAAALALARETKALVCRRAALAVAPDLLRQHFPGRRGIIVADPTTFAIAGQAVHASLLASGLAYAEPFIFADPRLYAEMKFVEELEHSLRQHDAIPLAVGSGAINDIVKLAAHRAGRSYLCVATAASMDGYTAYGASITYRGAKQMFDCPAPRAVLADIAIIATAPPELTAAGYADLLAKVTAGADWILADALGVEAIEPRAWELVQSGLRAALADPTGARTGREDAIVPLVEGLMLGGFAMQWTRSSRPASGAEHQFSHLWDMENHTHEGRVPLHGFKVGLGTLAVAALYELMLRRPFDRLDVERCCALWPDAGMAERRARELFSGDNVFDTALTEIRAKHATVAVLRQQLTRLRDSWPSIREKLQLQLMPVAELRSRLQAVGAPTQPEQIGLSRARLRQSFLRAQHIRRRFTVLDLAVRTACLDESLEAMFGESGS